ncbi:Uncharacterised protein [Salmonella enterica subsp. enterica serovar Bovismorbificans]|uniref:Uncharacterized protein n=1 Tax=Salmonella enterica subsp. enterica serovar Bovismorbificans TaxID=58097 RepID=A0A655D4W6_SALET|nr:Uncharacterised protein [Salmonella enterica subsp. enterica serovar Bovismorbificans]
MKRVTFQRGALCGGHHKTVIKSGVMRDHNGAATTAVFDTFTHHFENSV